MIRVLRILLRSAYVLAWIVLLLAGALAVVEESGVLARVVRTKLAERLGPLGDGLDVGKVTLRWFEPGIVIDDIRIRAVGDTDATSEELVHLHSVHLTLDYGLLPHPLDQIHIDGGRVLISNRLMSALDDTNEALAQPDDSPGFDPPPVIVSNLEIDVAMPWATLRLGSADLTATPRANATRGSDGDGQTPEFDVRGEFTPLMSGAVAGSRAIQIVGTSRERRIELQARAYDLDIDVAGITPPLAPGTLPLNGFSGLLSLNAKGYLDLGETFDVGGTARARVSDARLQPREDDPWLEDLEVDLEGNLQTTGDDLWARDAWNVVCRTRTTWKNAPTEAWAVIGQNVPEDAWVRVFGRVERFPLDRPTLLDLGATPDFKELWEVWDAVTPQGWADASFDLFTDRVRNDDGSFEYPPVRGAVHVLHSGETGVTFNGFVMQAPEQPGDRGGIAMPATGIRGQTVVTVDLARERPLWITLAELSANHATGPVTAWGMISSRPEDHPGVGPYLDIGFDVAPMELNDEWHAVLSTSPLTRHIHADYNPTTGLVATQWRLRDAPTTKGLSADGYIQVENAQVAWSGLPVPMFGTSGSVNVHFAEHASRLVLDENDANDTRALFPDYRPFGVTFDLRNDQGPPHAGIRARVSGIVREDDVPPVVRLSDIPHSPSWSVDVEIEEIGLRGRDADILAEHIEAFGPQRQDLGARGKVHAIYESAQPTPSSPYEAHIEITPREVELQPVQFNLRTSRVAGQLLIHTVLGQRETGENGEYEESFDMRFALTGRWAPGVQLGATGELRPAGDGEVNINAAGVDGNNPALRAAAADAMRSDRPGAARVDLSKTSLSAFDFGLLIPLDINAPEDWKAPHQLRLFLHEASLSNGSVQLDGINGVLVQSGDELRSPQVLAKLAGHPLVLSDVLVFALDRAEELDQVDDHLIRSGFVGDDGIGFQATIDTTHLPLDDAHLASLMDEEALSSLRSSQSWQGFVDLTAARILVTSPDDARDDGVVVLRGAMRPHDVTINFGLPMTITTADVDLREMVFERGSVRAWAIIDSLDGTIADRKLTEAKMILGLVDQRLTVDDLDGAFEGGRLRSLGFRGGGARKAIGVDLTPPHRFDMALEATDVDVESLMRGVFRSSIADTGVMNATLELAGTPDAMLELTGRGSMRLDKGRLWSIPAVRALFSQLGFPNTATFRELRSRFELRNGVIDTHYLEVRSSLLKLVGDGRLSLDGDLEYDLDVRYSLLDSLGILNRVIYWLNRSLMRVAIRGDFERPRVLIRSTFLELFGGSPDEDRRGLPLPPFAPLGERF